MKLQKKLSLLSLAFLLAFSPAYLSAIVTLDPSLTNWAEKMRDLAADLNSYAKRLYQSEKQLREYEMRLQALATELDLLLMRLEVSQRVLTELSESLENTQTILNELKISSQTQARKHRIEKIGIGILAGISGVAIGITGTLTFLLVKFW